MPDRLRVKELAKEKGFSLGRLQREAGLSYNTVRDIYRDPYKEVKRSTLEKIAVALGVKIAALYENEEPTHEA